MLAKVELNQDSKEWLEWRKDKIGASDLPIILGISKYCSVYNLWRKKVGFLEDDVSTPAMLRGKYMEPYMRDKINSESDFTFVPLVCEHKELKWAIASLDGYDEIHNVVLEIKCTSKDDHALAEQGKVPEHHMAQVQWQLFVTGAENAIYMHYYNDDVILVDIKRDDEYIKDVLLPEASEFYRKVVYCEAPETDEKDYVHIVDEGFKEFAEKWKVHSKERKYHEKLEKEFRDRMLEFTDDGNCVGYGVRITRTKPRETVNWKELYKELSEEHPEIANKYSPYNYTSVSIGYWRVDEMK